MFWHAKHGVLGLNSLYIAQQNTSYYTENQ